MMPVFPTQGWLRVYCLMVLALCSLQLPDTGYGAWVEVVVDPQMAGDDKALADIDGDGYLDIVVGGKRTAGEPLTWYRYPTWDPFVIAQSSEEFTTEMDTADMDGDDDVDLVVCDGPAGINCRYYVNPRPTGDPTQKAAWTARNIGSTGDWSHDLRVADYNEDGRPDVLTKQGLFTQQANGAFSKGQPGGSAFGDIDGDRDLDIVAAGAWYENPGWIVHPAPAGGGQDIKIRVVDLNGDGRGEIVHNSGDGTGDLVWYAAGDPQGGTWEKHTVLTGVVGGHTLDFGDVDGDGDIDLLSAEMFGDVLVLLNSGDGHFISERLSGAGIHNGVLGDLDRDGDLDVMGCNYTGNPPLRIWRNQVATPPAPDMRRTVPGFLQLLLDRRSD